MMGLEEGGFLSEDDFPFHDNIADSPIVGNSSEEVANDRNEDLAKYEILILFLIFVLTVLGNGVVLLGIALRKQKLNRMYYFILHLSIADLITAFLNVLPQLFWDITYRFRGGNVLCKAVKFGQLLGPYSSAYVLVMTAIDRYQAICFPMSDFSCTWKSKVMGAVWTFSALLCLPQTFIFSFKEISPGSGTYDCWATFMGKWGQEAYVVWYAVSVFLVPLIILIFTYSCICRTIWINISYKNATMKKDYQFSVRYSRKSRDSFTVTEADHNFSTIQEEGGGTEILTVTPPPPSNGSTPSQSRTPNVNDRRKNSSPVMKHIQNVQLGEAIHENSNLLGKQNILSSKSSLGVVPKIVNIPIGKTNGGGNFQCPSIAFPSPSDSSEEDEDERRGNGAKHQTTRSSGRKKSGDEGSKIKDRSGSVSEKIHLFLDAQTSTGSRDCKQAISVKCSDPEPPRAHSVKGISRAKIKTVKLTVTVICCYIFCSTPFIAAQLWVTFDPNASQSQFFSGAVFTLVMLLASLNSLVNPWIFLAFNPNLFQDFLRGFRRMRLNWFSR